MASRSPVLKKWQIAELAALIVEMELAKNFPKVEVEYNALVPIPGTRRKRQVEVAVTATVMGRKYLRLVEVQDRSRRVGEEFIDRIEGKLRLLHAHRATIVAAAGYTGPALERLRASGAQLDAMILHGADSAEWLGIGNFPSTITLNQSDGNEHEVQLYPYNYFSALADGPRWHVQVGQDQIGDREVIIATIAAESVEVRGTADVAFWVLGRGVEPIDIAKAEIEMETPEGVTYTLRGRRTRRNPVSLVVRGRD